MEWSPDLSMVCFRIDMRLLAGFAASVDAYSDRGIAFKKKVSCPRALQSLLGCARLAEFAAAQLAPGGVFPAALASRIRDQMLLTVLLSQPNTPSAKLTTEDRCVGRAVVGKAVEYILAHPSTATPSEVAHDVGVSLRALEVNFRDALGMTPSTYILSTRLRRAHEDLQAAQPDVGLTISGVARRWGFSNVGRFALQYRQMYAENPAETLKRALGRLGSVPRSRSGQAAPSRCAVGLRERRS